MELRIGASSWTSEAWWDRLYPRFLRPGERLPWYARLYDCVEVDATYYAVPDRRMVASWYARTPERFLFTLKLPREFLDPKKPLDREKLAGFLATTRLLREKLGAVLVQFAPWVRPGRASDYVWELLRALEPGLPYSLELRDAGWFSGPTHDRLLRELHDRAIPLTWSSLTYVDVPPELTTDWLYLRFIADHRTVPAETHGELRVDRSQETKLWAERVRQLAPSLRRVLAFFNNHFAGFAPASINLFRELLGLPPVDYTPPALERRANPPVESPRAEVGRRPSRPLEDFG